MTSRGLKEELQYGKSAGSALLDAINNNKLHLAKFILDAMEGDALEIVDTRDFKGKTPLIRAVYITEEKCRQKAMQLLLSRGAHPNAYDDVGRTALSYACELRHNDVVKLLVRWNVDPDLPDNKGYTPLMYCASVGNDVGIRILVKCFRRLGLDVDRENKDGFTALHIAAKHGFTECANQLATEGYASVTKTDRHYRRTAEQWARSRGCTTPEVALFSSGSKQRRPRASTIVSSNNHTYPNSKSNAHHWRSSTTGNDITISTISHTAKSVTDGALYRPKRVARSPVGGGISILDRNCYKSVTSPTTNTAIDVSNTPCTSKILENSTRKTRAADTGSISSQTHSIALTNVTVLSDVDTESSSAEEGDPYDEPSQRNRVLRKHSNEHDISEFSRETQNKMNIGSQSLHSSANNLHENTTNHKYSDNSTTSLSLSPSQRFSAEMMTRKISRN